MNAPGPSAKVLAQPATAATNAAGSAAPGGDPTPPHELDRALHAQWARLTSGLSPAALNAAFMDWWVHVTHSPAKQFELATKAVRKSLRLAMHAAHGTVEPCDPCIEPLPQDKRFTAPEWQQWPFNLVYQAFLLQQQWWHVATTEVRGVAPHHERVVNFGARQWLDLFSPSNFVLTNPEVLAQTLRTGGTNFLQGMRHWVEDAARLAASQPPVGTERYRPGRDVAVTPGKVVLRNRLIELIQYTPSTRQVHAEPVLVVPSWIMKYYILDLSPANSFVRHLVGQGRTVFMISWRNPGRDDRELGMDDYLQDGVMAALQAVGAIVPGRRVHALGYCLGGTLLAIAAAAMARDGDTRLASMSLLAAQVDFTEAGELTLFIDDSQVTYLEDLMSAQGYLDGKQMAGAFALLNSRDLVFSRMVRNYLMGQREPVSELQAWNADATRLPFRQHSHYLRSLFLRNDLAEGRYRTGGGRDGRGRTVALQDIRVPIFALGTARDTVSPWRSVYKIHALADTEVTFCLTSGGHNVGVVSPPGPDAPGVTRSCQIATRAADAPHVDADTWQATIEKQPGSWWPAWVQWLRRHDAAPGTLVKPPAPGLPGRRGAPLDYAPGAYVLAP
ncbi:MAG: alpha/beta fold hydrolase [Rubrivivax sp.]|nr:alpha/beta fold hydrolase [Rubrivivax sp.]